jgi:hypothetical protein
MTSPYLPGMKAEINALILEWGKDCAISRFVSTLNTQGRLSGSFVTQAAAQKLWIQPTAGASDIAELGIDEQTTHLAWEDFTGFEMKAKDRILPSGESYEYDVIRVHRQESQLVSELKLVRRD